MFIVVMGYLIIKSHNNHCPFAGLEAGLFRSEDELVTTLDNIVGTHSLSLTLRECLSHKYLRTNFAHLILQLTVLFINFYIFYHNFWQK